MSGYCEPLRWAAKGTVTILPLVRRRMMCLRCLDQCGHIEGARAHIHASSFFLALVRQIAHEFLKSRPVATIRDRTTLRI